MKRSILLVGTLVAATAVSVYASQPTAQTAAPKAAEQLRTSTQPQTSQPVAQAPQAAPQGLYTSPYTVPYNPYYDNPVSPAYGLAQYGTQPYPAAQTTSPWYRTAPYPGFAYFAPMNIYLRYIPGMGYVIPDIGFGAYNPYAQQFGPVPQDDQRYQYQPMVYPQQWQSQSPQAYPRYPMYQPRYPQTYTIRSNELLEKR